MIQPDLSNKQNAANLLQEVVKTSFDDLSVRDTISINWAIAVLRSDDQEDPYLRNLPGSSVPEDQDAWELLDEGTFSWLKNTFTQMGFGTDDDSTCEASYQSSETASYFAVRLQSVAPPKETLGFDRKNIALNELARPLKENDEIKRLLETSDQWGFDILEFKKVTNGHPLFHLGLHVLEYHDLIERFAFNVTVLKNWLAVVEASYNDPEYHNATHAADVLQCVHYMLTRGGAASFLTPFHTLALILSAIVHDLGHDGFNNDFHRNTLSERAIMFNDQSVQENFHLKSFCDQTLTDPTVNIFECLTSEHKLDLRRLIIELVLATDMTFHGKKQEDLQAAILVAGQEPEHWKDKAKLFMAAVLHACDISNPARPVRLATHWAQSVQQEFWTQGDRERELGLHSQPQFIKGSMDTPTSQIGFINYVVLPYYRVVHEVLPGLDEVVQQLESNLEYWRKNQNKGELIKRRSSSFAMSFNRSTANLGKPPQGMGPLHRLSSSAFIGTSQPSPMGNQSPIMTSRKPSRGDLCPPLPGAISPLATGGSGLPPPGGVRRSSISHGGDRRESIGSNTLEPPPVPSRSTIEGPFNSTGRSRSPARAL